MEVSETSSCVRLYGYHIYKHFEMQLLVKNSDVTESLIQTEAIDMQSLLKDGIITSHLLHKYHKPAPFS